MQVFKREMRLDDSGGLHSRS